MTDKPDLEMLKVHKSAGNKEEFSALLSGFVPQLKELIRHKLHQWEVRGIVPKNEYSAEDVIDEVYLKVYEEFHETLSDPGKLKVKMYGTAREVLNALKEKHGGGETVSVEELVARESKALEEKYTADAEGELILMEELDDISYQPREQEGILLLQEEQIDELAEKFDLTGEEGLSKEEKKRIGKTYSDLPELTRSVIDHHVFVELSNEQIAEIHQMSAESVSEIIGKVKKRMRAQR